MNPLSAAFWLGGELGPDGALVLTASEGWKLAAAGLVLGVVAVGQIRPRALGPRLLELALTALGGAALWFALAGPVWVEESGRTEDGRVVVLVDASRSMSVLDDGRPRSEVVPGVLDAIRAQLPAGAELDVYRFGDDLEIGAPTAYDLPGTDLGSALGALSERAAGEKLASVVIVTDGIDRGLLRKSWELDPKRPPPQVPGPLTLVQVGSRSKVLDLAVRSVDAGGYAFIRAPFAITADLLGVGFEGRTVPVTLTRDGATVTSQNVSLDGEGRGRARFDVTAEDAGRFAYAVTVPVYAGDAVPANNTMPVVVKVVRDRVRVLQVAGSPSWDVKFLRRFLKDDPSVQLVSFFILRTREDLGSPYEERELSLIEFPYERLFSSELGTFDVVVFQNFDYAPYFTHQSNELLGNVRRYVEEGGALVMVGGDRSFELGRYQGSPLAEVLPVELAMRPGEPSLAPFPVVLTEEGRRHPITRLVSEDAENTLWWSRLHELDGTNVPLRARPDAAVLLAHPTLTGADGEPLPILSVREVGAGRTMALTVDTSWRWSLSEAAVGRGNQVYLRFWKNALRWLMKDGALSRVTVETPRENYVIGEEARVVIRARDAGFAPLPNAAVELVLDNEGRERRLEGRTGPDGDLVLVVAADHPGTFRLEAEVATAEGEPVGSAESVFAVTTRDPEVDEIAPDEAFLAWLAGSTGGVRHPADALGPVLRDPAAARTLLDRRETPLWRAPGLLAAVSVALGLAWIVRRRSGLR